MEKKMTWFISDLHLDPSQSEIVDLFLKFLIKCHQDVDALYILGDFFETWIGDDDTNEFNLTIIKALHEATQKGLPIYFLHGNRDFLIGKKFLKQTGCTLLDEETVIDLYGVRVLLMHGDTLCTLDENYQKARKKLRNPIVQQIFLSLPLKLRRLIATKMRAKSATYTQTTSKHLMDVTQTEVYNKLQKHNSQLIIHGHTHKPGIHSDRIVLGAWHNTGNGLMWHANGKKYLINF